LAQEDDPTSDAAGTFSEPPQDAADAGFGDELPGMEQALRDGGVLRDDPPGGAAEGAASYEDAVSFLDDFVARLDARMAAASKVVPAAENLQAVIFEVAANVTAADNGAAFPSDEEDVRRRRTRRRRRRRRTRRRWRSWRRRSTAAGLQGSRVAGGTPVKAARILPLRCETP
jgi:hypothetical protein